MTESSYAYTDSTKLLYINQQKIKQQLPNWSAHQPPTSNVPLYNLQDVIQRYQSQPELLKLILTSKVEEDKRRAEEAKLRAKELDVYLQQGRSINSCDASGSPPNTPRLSDSNISFKELCHYSRNDGQRKNKRKASSTSTDNAVEGASRSSSFMYPSDSFMKYRKTALSSSTEAPHQEKSNHYEDSQSNSQLFPSLSVSSMSSLSSLSEIFEEQEGERSIPTAALTAAEDHQKRRESAAVAMLVMGRNKIDTSSSNQDKMPSPATTSTQEKRYGSNDKSRRRREMQAITKIVETREFPYIDDYFWKNNGNTVQKKTGCKSIYYKCSNSNKGCTVNKTVTARVNGEYLIKYRGAHLSECGKVERIRDI